MGNRSSRWRAKVRARARRDHARKKAVKRQKQHLRTIKTERELRVIVLGSRQRQKVRRQK